MMRFSLPTEAYPGLITVGTIFPCQVANRNTEVSTTCGSGWIRKDYSFLLLLSLDPPATAGGTDLITKTLLHLNPIFMTCSHTLPILTRKRRLEPAQSPAI